MDEQPQFQAPVPSTPPQQPAFQAPTQAPSNGKRVLCVEDEYFISELYDRALVKAGYQVDTIIDGPAGLAAAQTNQYDIILLDIMLPNMSGLEVLQILRDPARTPNFKSKIIITTNLDQGEESRKDVEVKADGYIVKAEVTPRQLVEFLEQLNV